MMTQEFVDQMNDIHNSLIRANQNAVAGTGCVNVAELRMAFDILRERLEHKYGESWGPKKIAGVVTERLYMTMAEAAGEAHEDPNQMKLF